ncbi:hypothetical protein NLI96_g13236 [Meripilus lineatus]|uniref:Uncharacterized protein n=1 Tax=Meripilus lineatus TaxID=2056292 RepID=A0AAD5Y7H5_9APHY|nr:hypothetical protein NLI96_g13236 [Physisporinus lineatus]
MSEKASSRRSLSSVSITVDGVRETPRRPFQRLSSSSPPSSSIPLNASIVRAFYTHLLYSSSLVSLRQFYTWAYLKSKQGKQSSALSP